MEIDIPDLDDVEFEEKCRSCGGKGTTEDFNYNTGETKTATCWFCSGKNSTSRATEVGKKLIKFLQSRGVTLKLKEGDE